MSKFDTKSEIEKELIKLLGNTPILPKQRRKRKSRSSFGKCEVCGKSVNRDHHHITYEPEVIALICRACHKRITAWNTSCATLTLHNRRSLYNVERVKIWVRFMKRAERERTSGNVVRNGADNQKPISSLSL